MLEVSLFNHPRSSFSLRDVAILESNSEVGGGLTRESHWFNDLLVLKVPPNEAKDI